MLDKKFKSDSHTQTYDRLLTRRIKEYEERFGVKIVNIKELKMSIKRFEVIIDMTGRKSIYEIPVFKRFKFGSRIRGTFFDKDDMKTIDYVGPASLSYYILC